MTTARIPREILGGAANGLRVREGISFEEWLALGRRISTVANASTWWLGDWLLYGQEAYGDRYRNAIAATGFDYQTLRNFAWVAHCYDVAARHETLSFSHHAEVASLPDSERKSWLELAEQHGWSRNELRRRVALARRARNAQAASPAPVQLRVPISSDRERRWREAAAAAGQEFPEWLSRAVDAAAESLLVDQGPRRAVIGDRAPSALTLAHASTDRRSG